MATWTAEELRQIAGADDLHVAPFREDGVTHGTPKWVLSVAVDDAPYVRAYKGWESGWYGAAIRQGAGRITAAGTTKDVAFEPVDGPTDGRIDDAYRAKYRGSPYLGPMIGSRARRATVKVMPRDSDDSPKEANEIRSYAAFTPHVPPTHRRHRARPPGDGVDARRRRSTQ